MSKLKAMKPEKKDKRLKIFIYGPAGVGKTYASLQFPNSYIIDTERGTDEYHGMIKKQNSAVFQGNDFVDIRSQVEELMAEKHEYRTLIIDPITQVYDALKELWQKRFERDALSKGKDTVAEMQNFGAQYWGKVKSDHKNLIRSLFRLDMNVIVTAHQKDLYAEGTGNNLKKIGVTFDSDKKDEYAFDIVFRLENQNGKRIAHTMKERAEPGLQKFPASFEWSYENMIGYYGREIIERTAQAVPLATPENVQQIKALIDTLKISPDDLEKWFTKADVDTFEEMSVEQIEKCIAFCNKKIEVLKGGQNG